MKAHLCAAAAFAGTWLSMVRSFNDALRSIAAAHASRAAVVSTMNALAVFLLCVQGRERLKCAYMCRGVCRRDSLRVLRVPSWAIIMQVRVSHASVLYCDATGMCATDLRIESHAHDSLQTTDPHTVHHRGTTVASRSLGPAKTRGCNDGRSGRSADCSERLVSRGRGCTACCRAFGGAEQLSCETRLLHK